MKGFIKYVAIYIYAILRHNRNSKIIYYHDVHDERKYTDMGTHIGIFKKHITTIQNSGYEIVPHITSDRNQVMICFDDGFRGIWDCKQFFIDNNIRPTIFIAVDLIGKDGYLTIEEIKTLHEHGFHFECHTWSHVNLTTLSDTELIREIEESKAKLEDMLGFPINDICFPQGYFNDKIYELAVNSGYRWLYSSLSGNYTKRYKTGLLCRYLVQHATTKELKLILQGGGDIFFNWNLRHHYCKKML